MRVLLEAIKFNHDQTSATTDAFNIRKNETQFVTVPEWQRGVSHKPEDSPAAYAICETRGKTITIQAKFKCDDLSIEAAQVRALDARASRSESLGCGPAGLILSLLLPRQRPLSGNVLGVVKEKQVRFNANGETDFVKFALQNTQLSRAGVSASTTEWRWQFRLLPSDRWTDFATTTHRIYTVLEVPALPWQQKPYDGTNTQLPWTEVLDYACQWAASAQDPDEAATLITRNVFNLGTEGLIVYGGSPFYSTPNFDCTKFLGLLRDRKGMAQKLNCSDCAAIVSSFANILGCQLWQSIVGPHFRTNPVRLIGRRGIKPRDFIDIGHEVAWKGDCKEDDELFDACLQVDGDEDPKGGDFDPLLPAKLRFGKPGENSYRFRLAPPPTGATDNCRPLPGNRQHRKVGKQTPGRGKKLDDGLLDFAKEHYQFESWRSLSPSKKSVSAQKLFTRRDALNGWTLDSVQHQQMERAIQVKQSLWQSIENPEWLLRVDIFKCENVEDARALTLHLLGEFQLDNIKLLEPAIGDVAFVEEGGISILFAVSDHVFLIRSAGKSSISIMETALQLNQQLS
ncbi:MAG TPA: hypothetical protein VF735_14150 [Pyrinomonadaceae bacterium]|jgi:hypothetical protein